MYTKSCGVAKEIVGQDFEDPARFLRVSAYGKMLRKERYGKGKMVKHAGTRT